MKVLTRVHYGVRSMTELARPYREERLLSISEIARNEDLPVAYLEQLVGELRRAGLVEGTRGVHGGEQASPGPEAAPGGAGAAGPRGERAPPRGPPTGQPAGARRAGAWWFCAGHRCAR